MRESLCSSINTFVERLAGCLLFLIVLGGKHCERIEVDLLQFCVSMREVELSMWPNRDIPTSMMVMRYSML